MTATRMLKGATIILAAAAWFIAAALLWRTKVPANLHPPRFDAPAFFSPAQLHRAARYSSVGRLLFFLGVALQLAVLVVLSMLGRRLARGFALGEIGAGVMIGVAASLFVTIATLPVGLAGLWLDRRDGVSEQQDWSEALGPWTRDVNAETTGVGPTTVVILWDTLFKSHLSDRAIEFVTAHELGHAVRRHVLKGLGWGLLFTVPLIFLLAEATRRRGGMHRAEVVPFALLVAFTLSLLATPLENVVSRRYESEADWMALQTTCDPAAGREAFRSFTRIDLAQPNPPEWSYVLLDDHPTVLQRIAMTVAWEARTRTRTPAGPSPAGS